MISGLCTQARAEAVKSRLHSAARFHAGCPGRWHGPPTRVCDCYCHAANRPDPDSQLQAERLRRQAAAGINLSAPPPKVKPKICHNGHRMTRANTGPRGDCRACKRISSAKSKARKKGLSE